jgi:hypothetical protein
MNEEYNVNGNIIRTESSYCKCKNCRDKEVTFYYTFTKPIEYIELNFSIDKDGNIESK